MIRTENLSKVFRNNLFVNRHDKKALDNLNLHVESGEIFGYLGPNGAGKTTTFKLLLGLIYPTSGNAWILGSEIGDVKSKSEVGFLPEQPYFYDYLTGIEFLDFYAQLFRIDRKTRKRRIRELLEAVGLEEAGTTQLRKFSRGMLQRIGIAQALINDPELVILDEPLSGLDPVGRKQIRNIIFRLKEEGRTVIFSSHVLSDVEAICDRAGILIKGVLQRVQRIDELVNVETESVDITVSGMDVASIEAVKSAGADHLCKAGRDVFSVHNIGSMEGEEVMSTILRTVRQSGAKLISITSQTRSLEELFVSLSDSRNSAEDSELVSTVGAQEPKGARGW